jgi:P27 family predicted phage terminase small subunit
MTDDAPPAAPAPPEHLRKDGRDFWQTIVQEHDLESHQLALLCLACEQFDTQDQARKVIAQHGMTYATKTGTVKPRPELSIERQAARLISTLLRQLKLDADQKPGERWVGRVKPHGVRVKASRRK